MILNGDENEDEGVSYLGLGHVQQAYRVAVTVEESADRIEGFVELSLDVSQLLKHLAGRPQQHLEPNRVGQQ